MEASDWEDPPNFGSSDTEFEDVRQFYGWWQSYCTKRNYMWLDDLYDIRQVFVLFFTSAFLLVILLIEYHSF